MNTNFDVSIALTFLEKLKNQSAAAHKKLESLTISTSILSPDMKIIDYCHYLSLMHDVHKSTEELIYPILNASVSDLEERKKTHLIDNDLLDLNYKKNKSTILFKNKSLTIPFALGILYVVEGSSLGGRYILKNVETISGLDQEKGVSYFSGYGNKTGSYWKTFLNILTAYEEQNNCSDEIIEGAIYAFDCIYSHFLNTVRNEN